MMEDANLETAEMDALRTLGHAIEYLSWEQIKPEAETGIFVYQSGTDFDKDPDFNARFERSVALLLLMDFYTELRTNGPHITRKRCRRWRGFLKVASVILLLASTLCAQQTQPHSTWKKPLVLNALAWSAMAADVEGTQHCLNAGSCHEANPMMPSGAGRAWALNISVTGASTLLSVLMRKHHVKGWWALPVESTTLHTAGALSGWTK